jgi:hypothetical protein
MAGGVMGRTEIEGVERVGQSDVQLGIVKVVELGLDVF